MSKLPLTSIYRNASSNLGHGLVDESGNVHRWVSLITQRYKYLHFIITCIYLIEQHWIIVQSMIECFPCLKSEYFPLSNRCFPCAFIPCCVNSLKSVAHTCPNCRMFLGRYKGVGTLGVDVWKKYLDHALFLHIEKWQRLKQNTS